MTPRETVPLGYAAAILRYPTCPLVDDGDRCFLELTRDQHDRLRDMVREPAWAEPDAFSKRTRRRVREQYSSMGKMPIVEYSTSAACLCEESPCWCGMPDN